MPDPVKVPATCEARPTVGGLVIPWINVALADGGVDFRRQHNTRLIEALARKLCQVCGGQLGDRIVLLGGPANLEQLVFGEPPLHSECAVYTSQACPMVAGQLTKYPTGPSVSEGKRGQRCDKPGCDCDGWMPATPHDATDPVRDANPWYAVYATKFTIALRKDKTVLGALVDPEDVLAVRLVSRPGEGRCWTLVPDALAGYVPPDTILA